MRTLGIDALYAGGAKWLLALAGVGLLSVAPALRERLAVRRRGWRDVADIGTSSITIARFTIGEIDAFLESLA